MPSTLAQIASDMDKDGVAQRLSGQTLLRPEAIADGLLLPGIMLQCREAELGAPERYAPLEARYRQLARVQSDLISASPLGQWLSEASGYFRDYSYAEQRDEVESLPLVRPWLTALEVSPDKRNELWHLIDEEREAVITRLSDGVGATLLSYLNEAPKRYDEGGPDWQHLSPWNWVNFFSDTLMAGSILAGGAVSLVAAPLAVPTLATAGVLFIAGSAIKNKWGKGDAS